MRNLLFFAFATALAGQTQVDFNTQIKHSPVSYVAVVGIPLATSMAKVPTGGSLIVPAGTWPVATSILPASNTSIVCQPGAVIQAARNNYFMITVAGPFVIDGCIMDGNFTGGKTGVDAIVLSGSSGAVKVIEATIQNVDNLGIAVLNSTGSLTVSKTLFSNIGNGVFSEAGTGTGIIEEGTATTAAHLSSLLIDSCVFDNFTSGDGVHIFNLNTSTKEVVRITHSTFTRQARAAIECSAVGASLFSVTDTVIGGFENNGGSNYQAGISCELEALVATGTITMDGAGNGTYATGAHFDAGWPGLKITITVAGNPLPYVVSTVPNTTHLSLTTSGPAAGTYTWTLYADNDAPLVVQGVSLALPPSAPYGHGLGIESFTRHLLVSDTKFDRWGITFSGGLEVTNSVFLNSPTGIANNPTFPTEPVTIINNVFTENCIRAIGAFRSPGLRVQGNVLTRTPGGICTALDAAVNGGFLGIEAGGDSVTGGADISHNSMTLLAGTAPAGAAYYGIVPFGVGNDLFEGNKFTDNNMTPIFNAYFGTNNFNLDIDTVRNNEFYNMAVIYPWTGGTATRVSGNVDLTGTITTRAQGIFLLQNRSMPYGTAFTNVCSQFTNGNQLVIDDSSTATWGAAITGSGTNTVTGVCNGAAQITSGTYVSGGSVTGTATQTCHIAVGGDTLTVLLTGTNTIAAGTAYSISGTQAFITRPVSGTLSSGTATCSGTAVITSVLSGTVVGYTVLSK